MTLKIVIPRNTVVIYFIRVKTLIVEVSTFFYALDNIHLTGLEFLLVTTKNIQLAEI